MKKSLIIALLLLTVTTGSAVAAAEEHGDPTLDGHYWQNQLVKTVNFLVIVLAGYYILRKPISEFFSKRAEQIETDLKSAERARNEAEKRLAEVEAEVAAINQRVGQIIGDAKKEAENERDRILHQARAEARKIQEMTDREIEGRLKAARLELRQYATQLAVEQARDIIRDELSDEGDRELIERNIKQIGGVH